MAENRRLFSQSASQLPLEPDFFARWIGSVHGGRSELADDNQRAPARRRPECF
jgi:hypothetical protein